MLLDALARAPAAAALIVSALSMGDRRALHLAHPAFRDAFRGIAQALHPLELVRGRARAGCSPDGAALARAA